MNIRMLIAAGAVTLAAWAANAPTVQAWFPSEICAAQNAAVLPWHGGFYDPNYGQPVALVVPPNAEVQTNWGWGVGNTRTTPIYHQFHRRYPGAYPGPAFGGGAGFLAQPMWPSDTHQFGYYYVRGPW